jgi:cis-3-alkyl-4-acyloxetan-2-one decarboxylase
VICDTIRSMTSALAAPSLPAWLEAMLPFRRSLLPLSGHQIHVMERGPASATPVVMVHGNPTWGFLYRKVAAALEREAVRVILPDLVGLGLSSKPRDPDFHSIERHAEILGAVVDAVAPGRFHLVVQDWGGPIALRMAADRRERLAGLVLLNTVIGPPRPGFKPTLFHRVAHLPVVGDLLFHRLPLTQLGMPLVQGDKGSIRGDVARAYRWPLRRFDERIAPLALARMVPDSPQHPSIPALERVHDLVTSWRGPTEVVWGTRDPILGRVVGHVENLLPHARVTRTDAGHFLQEEVPLEIAAAVTRLTGSAPAGR